MLVPRYPLARISWSQIKETPPFLIKVSNFVWNYSRYLAVRSFIKVDTIKQSIPHLRCLQNRDERPNYHYIYVIPKRQHTNLQVKKIGTPVEQKTGMLLELVEINLYKNFRH